MIPLQCPACRNSYEVPDEDAGAEVQCECGQLLVVPNVPSETDGVAENSVITVRCQSCLAEYEVGFEEVGTEAQCVCGQLIEITWDSQDAVGISSNQAVSTINVSCPECQSAYEVPVEDAGTQAQCVCGALVDIPPSSKAGSGSPETAPLANAIPVTCPSCSSQYQLGPEDANTEVQCPCGQVILVPTLDCQTTPAGATTNAGTQETDNAASQAARAQSPVSQANNNADDRADAKRQKKNSKTVLYGGIAGGIIIAALVTVLILREPTKKRPAGNDPVADAGQLIPNSQFPGPASWKSWVSTTTNSITVLNPNQLFVEPIFDKAAIESIHALVQSSTGLEMPKLERIYWLEDLVNGGDVLVVEASEKINRSRVHSALLPGSEAVSGKTLTWFRGARNGVCFPDPKTIVLASASTIESQLKQIEQRKTSDSALLGQVKATDGAVNTYFSIERLIESPEGVPLEKKVLEKVNSIELAMRLNSRAFLSLRIHTQDEDAARQIETLCQTLRPTLLTEFFPEDEGHNANATSDNIQQLGMQVLRELIDGLTVRRRVSDVELIVTQPRNLKKLLAEASNQMEILVSLVTGRSNEIERSTTGDASSTNSAIKSSQNTDATQTVGGDNKPKQKLNWPIAATERFRSFKDASDAFIKKYSKAVGLVEEIKDAEPDAKRGLVAQRLKLQREAAGIAQQMQSLGVRLLATTGNIESLVQARFLLAYMYSELKLYYEAALLAEWVADNDPDPQSKRAMDAAFVALLSWQATYQAAGQDREAERNGFVGVAHVLNQTWPDDPKVASIRYTVGQILQIDHQDEPAANWYAMVKSENPRYAEAQLNAGQCCWRSYLEKSTQARELRKAIPSGVGQNAVNVEATQPENSSQHGGPTRDESKKNDPVEKTGSVDERGTENDNRAEDGNSDKADSVAFTKQSSDKSSPLVRSNPTNQNTNALGARINELEANANMLLDRAEQHLSTGISLLDQPPAENPKTPPTKTKAKTKQTGQKKIEDGLQSKPKRKLGPKQTAKTYETLIVAKLTLAQIRLKKTQFDSALTLLSKSPNSVIDAISLGEDEQRPARGLKSLATGILAWKLILRSHMGLGNLDAAKDAMAQLDTVASGDPDQNLMTTYVSLGRDLKDELIPALQQADPTIPLGEDLAARLKEFIDYLNAVAQREPQTYGSLLWIGDSATELAGVVGDSETAQPLHALAAECWQKIIAAAAKDRDFCTAQTVAAMRIRVARSLRDAAEFEQSVKAFAGLLALQPNSFSLQFDTARTLQAWGEQPGQEKLLLESVNGRGETIWGWGKTSVSLQRLMASENSKPEYRDMMLEARYQIALARRSYAKTQDDADRTKTLEKALTEIRTTARLSQSLDGDWWDKLDEQYQAIMTELKLEPTSIRDLGDE